MARLVWGNSKRKYETGIDRGVLYFSEGPGVAWNGLITVEESGIEDEVRPFYFDGIKYRNVVPRKDYKATVSAFSVPYVFLPCLGEQIVIPGCTVANQPRSRFNFSYRTLIGTDEYKIHLVYNALANPTSRDYRTIDGNVSPIHLGLEINAVPPRGDEFRPNAHLVIDSTLVTTEKLAELEKILYGSDGDDIIDGGIPTFSSAGSLNGGTPFTTSDTIVTGGNPYGSGLVATAPYLPSQREIFALMSS